MIICGRVLGAQVLRDVLCAHRAEGGKVLRPGHGREPPGLAGAGLSEEPDGKPGVARGAAGFGGRQHCGGLTCGVRGQCEPGFSGQRVKIAVSWPGA